MAFGGPGFGEALFKNQLAQKQSDLAEMELGVKEKQLKLQEGELGFKLADLDERRQAAKQQAMQRLLQSAITGFEPFAAAVEKLGPNFKPGSPLDKGIDVQKNIAAQAIEMAGGDPRLAQALADRVRSLSQAQAKPVSVGPGASLINPQTGETVASVPPVQSMDTIEIPGEFGTTRIQRGTGGAMPVAGASGAPGAAPAGQGGKPLPKDAQEALTGGFASLKALDDMEAGISQTGVVRGRVSNVQTAFGQNPEAIEFQTARNQFKLSAQSIIKGIPSNFDVGTLIDTLPDVTLPQSVNKSRIEFSRNVIKQLIEDTISYYKYTGARIPPDVLGQARKQGIRVDDVQPWDGQGTPTKNAENLLASGGKKPGVEGMSADELLKLDPAALSPADQKALDKRLKELGY